jgi:hypothetical protein
MESMRPRFRLRTLLVLVTLCALAAAAYRHYSWVYRPLVFHRQRVASLVELEQLWNSVSFDIPEMERINRETQLEFHLQMAMRYEYSLWRPWVQVPDFGPLVPSVKP